jgi:hypothetical protein
MVGAHAVRPKRPLDISTKLRCTQIIAFPMLVRYTCFSSPSPLPLAFCLKPITFVPQQTEKRYIPIIQLNKGG